MASLGICEFGFTFYSCDNGFKGCCRVDACGPDQCPEGQRTTTSYPVPYIDSSTTAPPDDTETPAPSPSTTESSTDDGSTTFVYPLPPSTTDPTSTTETTAQSTTRSSSPTSSSQTTSPTPSSTPQTTPAPPTVWIPIPTSAPQPSSSNDSHPRLSTTAIAGISVGGTVAAALLSLFGYLLIRRRCIARRNARASAANPFSFSSGAAEGFMADHPMWRGGDKGKEGGEGDAKRSPDLRGLCELP
ncbi:uncharacterized protein GGS22DRAFT_195505 [Annulohypoxylon maeteangense]|uniref:uncharacterized protein n=1 Tax=Annulohypoxylon maeteangense TaxID=1927788 RepID=UPI00200892CC|nr:uncharacterized protein GGS22DRAFT_195505 [Annulohypoxylon maeteangense]KAI0882728.1 hypothetical protein GGS22DRAFT_195505 [Annulohypoxylon maeteangense]